MACAGRGAALPGRRVVRAAATLLFAIVPMVVLKVLLPLQLISMLASGDDDAEATRFIARLQISSNLAAAATTCAVCELSDRVGRRPMLVTITAFSFLDGLVCALAPSPRWLLIGHTFASSIASPWALLAVTFGGVADIVEAAQTPDRVAVEFSFVEGAVFAAGIFAPASFTAIAQRWGFPAAYLCAAALSLVAFLAAVTAPETLQRAKTAPADDAVYSPLAGDAPADAEGAPLAKRRPAAWVAFTPLAALFYFGQSRRQVLVGAACFLHWVGLRGLEFLWPLLGHQLFHWRPAFQGLIYSGQGVVATFAMTIGARQVAILLRHDEYKMCLLFLALAVCGASLCGAAGHNEGAFIAGMFVLELEMPANAALRAMVVGSRGAHGRAAALGAAALLETAAELSAYSMMAKVLSVPALHSSAACFVAAASFAAAAVPVLLALPTDAGKRDALVSADAS
ncbi:major facilitator superfamily domain-containing protein [Pelagophyceae sp. CCMP2097]|nr:major facilitator superfamily domain-containing protein [Pelagophyceae sp. CCMP2097]